MNTVAIIQARMGASRLPNKVLLHLHGYPIVEWVYHRVKQSKLIDQVIFALPDIEQDDVLAKYLDSIGACVFRGSETDLVDRYYKVSKSVSADRVVRVCADNPLVCPSEIDRLVSFFHQNSYDYAYNHIPRDNQYPDGLGAEICSMDLLEKIYKQAYTPEHREHLFNYILDNIDNVSIGTFNPPEELAYPDLKLDIDTMEDYEKLLDCPYHIDMSPLEVVTMAIATN